MCAIWHSLNLTRAKISRHARTAHERFGDAENDWNGVCLAESLARQRLEPGRRGSTLTIEYQMTKALHKSSATQLEPHVSLMNCIHGSLERRKTNHNAKTSLHEMGAKRAKKNGCWSTAFGASNVKINNKPAGSFGETCGMKPSETEAEQKILVGEVSSIVR